MIDEHDTINAVMQLPALVQDAVDLLTDYLELFEDDEELYDPLYDLQELLYDVRMRAECVGQTVRARARNNPAVVPVE